MRKWCSEILPWLTLFFATGMLSATLARSAEPEGPPYGYTNTSLLPGTSWHVHDPARPLPPAVVPGPFVPCPAPSDAVILFDGKDLSQWADVKDGSLTNDFIATRGPVMLQYHGSAVRFRNIWIRPF